jgi:hypothetical protein
MNFNFFYVSKAGRLKKKKKAFLNILPERKNIRKTFLYNHTSSIRFGAMIKMHHKGNTASKLKIPFNVFNLNR